MKTILIHSNSNRNKALTNDFQTRLDQAMVIAKEKDIDSILITGGVRDSKNKTESDIALEYISKDCTSNIFIESRSKTSVENIVYSQNILKDFINLEELIVVSSDYHLPRLRYLYKKHFKLDIPKISFLGSKSGFTILKRMYEYILYIYYLIDPNEKFLAKVTKNVFRK